MKSLGESAPSCSEHPSFLPGRFRHCHFHVFQFWPGFSRADSYMNSLQRFDWNLHLKKISKKENPNFSTSQYKRFHSTSYTTVSHERCRTITFFFFFFYVSVWKDCGWLVLCPSRLAWQINGWLDRMPEVQKQH